MIKNITYSSWSADNIPDGIKFDSSSGSFSGTPNADAGEYLVPVHVITNYGSDSKNVKIIVEEKLVADSVYAIGYHAEHWSNNAAPDAYGFRKLPIPSSFKLKNIPYGFAAKSENSDWFLGSFTYWPIYGGNGKNEGISYYNVRKFEVDNVIDISGGRSNINNINTHYFAYKTEKETIEHRYTFSVGANSASSSVTFNRGNNISKMQEDIARGLAFISSDNGIMFYRPDNNPDITPDDKVVKALPVINWDIGDSNTKVIGVRYLTDKGELYEYCPGLTPALIVPETGFITNFWANEIYTRSIFILNSQKELFAKGYNTNYSLGFPDNTAYQINPVRLGSFDVKKIDNGFMLTKDGKLFHTGSAVSGVTNAHNKWTHIFPDYYFLDITFCTGFYGGTGGDTLVAIIKGA